MRENSEARKYLSSKLRAARSIIAREQALSLHVDDEKYPLSYRARSLLARTYPPYNKYTPLKSFSSIMKQAAKLIETEVTYDNLEERLELFRSTQRALFVSLQEIKSHPSERDQSGIKYDLETISSQKEDASSGFLRRLALVTLAGSIIGIAFILAKITLRESRGEIESQPTDRVDYTDITIALFILLIGNLWGIAGNAKDSSMTDEQRLMELKNSVTALTQNLYRWEIYKLPLTMVHLGMDDRKRRTDFWKETFSKITHIQDHNTRELGSSENKPYIYIGNATQDRGRNSHRALKLSYIYLGATLLECHQSTRELVNIEKTLDSSNSISAKLLNLISHYAGVNFNIGARFPAEILDDIPSSFRQSAEFDETYTNTYDAVNHYYTKADSALLDAKKTESEANKAYEEACAAFDRVATSSKKDREIQVFEAYTNLKKTETVVLQAEKEYEKATDLKTELEVFEENLDSLMVKLRSADKKLPTLAAKAIFCIGNTINVDWPSTIFSDEQTRWFKQNMALASHIRRVIDKDQEKDQDSREYDDYYVRQSPIETIEFKRDGELFFRLRHAKNKLKSGEADLDALSIEFTNILKAHKRVRKDGSECGGGSVNDRKCRFQEIEILSILARIKHRQKELNPQYSSHYNKEADGVAQQAIITLLKVPYSRRSDTHPNPFIRKEIDDRESDAMIALFKSMRESECAYVQHSSKSLKHKDCFADISNNIAFYVDTAAKNLIETLLLSTNSVYRVFAQKLGKLLIEELNQRTYQPSQPNTDFESYQKEREKTEKLLNEVKSLLSSRDLHEISLQSPQSCISVGFVQMPPPQYTGLRMAPQLSAPPLPPQTQPIRSQVTNQYTQRRQDPIATMHPERFCQLCTTGLKIIP